MDLHGHPQLRETHRADDLTSFCLDSPMEPFLRHSVELVFSDIVMTLGWSYLRCIDSRILISVEYRSDLLNIPIELSFIRTEWTLVAILGHIPPFQLWR